MTVLHFVLLPLPTDHGVNEYTHCCIDMSVFNINREMFLFLTMEIEWKKFDCCNIEVSAYLLVCHTVIATNFRR